MKKLTLLSIIPLAIIMADMNFPTSTQKGDSMSVVGAEGAPVNTSGIIPNSVDLIWDDMHEANTGQPAASSMSYGYVQGPMFMQQIYDAGYFDTWKRMNVWFEVEEGSGLSPQECSFTINKATNTQVEVTPMWLMWQDLSGGKFGNGQWHTLENGTGEIKGTRFPGNHGGDYDTDRGCQVLAINQERTNNPDYYPDQGKIGNNYLYLPDHYWWKHGWSTQKSIDPYQFNAVYGACYTRLVLIDPNGVDDRHLANFVIHVASDRKNATGGIVGPGLDTGGISRYKKIPTNGDWMPVNWVTGWVTKESLEANPPPFPTKP